MVITKEILERGKSLNNGWSMKQLAILGVPMPLVNGWAKRLIGSEVPDENVAMFLKYKDRHLSVRTLDRLADRVIVSAAKKEPVKFSPVTVSESKMIEAKAEFLVANFTDPITKSGSHITSCGHPEQEYLACKCK